jgi:hypothetical protein
MQGWIVTINGNETMRIEADSAAQALTLGGDRWREKYTGGEDRGEISTVDVRRDA